MPQISRRRMLRGSAVLLSGGAAGALATGSIATNAAAADVSLDVQGDSVEVREGNLAAVWLDLTAGWSYEVPSEESPDKLVVDVLAGTDPDAMDVVASDESDRPFLSDDDEVSFEADLLESEALDADPLVPTEGGTTTETTVHVGVEMRLVDSSGLVIAADSQTDTATVAITKSDYDPGEYGSVSGSGEITVELE